MILTIILVLCIIAILVTNLIFSLKVGNRFDITDKRIEDLEQKFDLQSKRTNEVLKVSNDLLNKM